MDGQTDRRVIAFPPPVFLLYSMVFPSGPVHSPITLPEVFAPTVMHRGELKAGERFVFLFSVREGERRENWQTAGTFPSTLVLEKKHEEMEDPELCFMKVTGLGLHQGAWRSRLWSPPAIPTCS